MNKIKIWAGKHKFWSAMIILFIIGIVLTWLGIINGFGFGRLLGNFIGIYIVIWLLNKIWNRKEKEYGKEKN